MQGTQSERERERGERITLGLTKPKPKRGLAWITRLFVIPPEGLKLDAGNIINRRSYAVDSRPSSYHRICFPESNHRAHRGIRTADHENLFGRRGGLILR